MTDADDDRLLPRHRRRDQAAQRSFADLSIEAMESRNCSMKSISASLDLLQVGFALLARSG
jgi:hypothetical protein